MLLKIVSLFLVAIAVMGLFGRIRWPGGAIARKPRDQKLARPKKCPKCGAFLIGSGPCNCRRKG